MLLPLLMNLRMLGEGAEKNRTGWKSKRGKSDKRIEERIVQAKQDALGITSKLSDELWIDGKERILAATDMEIGTLLHEKMHKQEDEALALILIMASVQ